LQSGVTRAAGQLFHETKANTIYQRMKKKIHAIVKRREQEKRPAINAVQGLVGIAMLKESVKETQRKREGAWSSVQHRA
jgi:hypothetical protein